jgi:hypothetical protein
MIRLLLLLLDWLVFVLSVTLPFCRMIADAIKVALIKDGADEFVLNVEG